MNFCALQLGGCAWYRLLRRGGAGGPLRLRRPGAASGSRPRLVPPTWCRRSWTRRGLDWQRLWIIHPSTDDSHFWDIALFYTADWNSIKISLAGAYTWLESNPLNGGEEDYWQLGGTVMHKPSGLGIYATGAWEDVSNADA